MNAIERKPNCVFYYVHDLFSFVLRPSNTFIWLHSKLIAGSDLTLINYHVITQGQSSSLVRWSRLLLPTTSEHHHIEKSIGKKWIPTLVFMEINQLLRVFYASYRKVLNKSDLIFHWGCWSVFLLLWYFKRHTMYHFEFNLLLKMFIVISLDYLFWCNAAEVSHFRNSAAVKGLFSLAQILFGLSRLTKRGNCQVMFFYYWN